MMAASSNSIKKYLRSRGIKMSTRWCNLTVSYSTLPIPSHQIWSLYLHPLLGILCYPMSACHICVLLCIYPHSVLPLLSGGFRNCDQHWRSCQVVELHLPLCTNESQSTCLRHQSQGLPGTTSIPSSYSSGSTSMLLSSCLSSGRWFSLLFLFLFFPRLCCCHSRSLYNSSHSNLSY